MERKYYIMCIIIWLSLNQLAVLAVYPKCSDDCYDCDPCCDYSAYDLINLMIIDIDCPYQFFGRIKVPDISSNNTDYSLIYSHSCLIQVPDNFCEFKTMKAIQLNYNMIKHVPNLSCLRELVYLDLSYNHIRILKTGIFDSLKNLKLLRLDNNEIKSIDSGVFHVGLHSLKQVYLEQNQLTEIDVWIFLNITHRFCYFDASNNKISQITNKNGHKVDFSKRYGPGMLSLQSNQLKVFPYQALKNVGFVDIRTLGLLFSWGFDLRNNPFVCDCTFYDFMSFVQNFVHVIPRNYMAVFCQEPLHLKGKLIYEVKLTDFVCNVTDLCPINCSCQDQPALARFLIDCEHSGLTQLPDIVPGEKKNLYLKFRNNSINRLDNRDYLHRVKYLDLSSNNISCVSSQFIDNLNSLQYIYLNDNNLQYLPKNIQKLTLSELELLNNEFICNCSNIWMSEWFKSKDYIKNRSEIECKIDNIQDVILIENITSDILQCINISYTLVIILSIIALIIIIVVIISIYFRYELLTLYYIKIKPKLVTLPSKYDYDVFISCNNEEDNDRIWIQNHLLPFLVSFKLRSYVSFRDGIYGEITTDKNIKTTHESCNVIVVISETYMTNPKTMFELNETFNHKVKKGNGKLILIKLGDFQTSLIKNNYIKSLFRLKLYLNSESGNLFDELFDKLSVTKFVIMNSNVNIE